jgi:superfamily I DNA/RNA helicase
MPTREQRCLTLDAYLALSKKRVKLDELSCRKVYRAFLEYQEFLARDGEGWWDEADRAMDILIRSRRDGNLRFNRLNEDMKEIEGPFDRVYVDEIQDSNQVEISLFALAGGFRFDNLFMAGDPAQAVEEGVDFRFKEVLRF